MFDFPWPTLLATAFIVLLAYSVYGLTGFGAAIVGIPLLAHFYPLRFAVAGNSDLHDLPELATDIGYGHCSTNHGCVNWLVW
jgi:uncharacterized membrane protein YfcA